MSDLKKAKFTPGPWVVEIDYDTEIEICADVRPDGDYISIATIENNSKKAKADANLISAAPDLYKALILFCKTLFSSKIRIKSSLKSFIVFIKKPF